MLPVPKLRMRPTAWYVMSTWLYFTERARSEVGASSQDHDDRRGEPGGSRVYPHHDPAAAAYASILGVVYGRMGDPIKPVPIVRERAGAEIVFFCPRSVWRIVCPLHDCHDKKPWRRV